MYEINDFKSLLCVLVDSSKSSGVLENNESTFRGFDVMGARSYGYVCQLFLCLSMFHRFVHKRMERTMPKQHC